VREFTHSPRGLIHIDGRVHKETPSTFTIHYCNGRIKVNKADLFNCHLRADRSIVVDVSPETYPRAEARTRRGHLALAAEKASKPRKPRPNRLRKRPKIPAPGNK
jgi:hypothetical protein